MWIGKSFYYNQKDSWLSKLIYKLGLVKGLFQAKKIIKQKQEDKTAQ